MTVKLVIFSYTCMNDYVTRAELLHEGVELINPCSVHMAIAWFTSVKCMVIKLIAMHADVV